MLRRLTGDNKHYAWLDRYVSAFNETENLYAITSLKLRIAQASIATSVLASTNLWDSFNTFSNYILVLLSVNERLKMASKFSHILGGVSSLRVSTVDCDMI
jgi:hypothetical protein